jgi:hypothetical protein
MKQNSERDYPDGSYYQGEMLGSKLNTGQAASRFVDGSVLKGVFSHGVCNSATIEFTNRSEYKGEVRGLKPHGIGLLKSS